MPQVRDKFRMWMAASREVTAEDKWRAWYWQLGTTLVLTAVLVGAAFLFGAGDQEWPVPTAFVASSLAAVPLARYFAYQRRKTRAANGDAAEFS